MVRAYVRWCSKRSGEIVAQVDIRAFIQRTAGSTTVRLWLLPTQRVDIAWYRDMDYAQALRDEVKQSEADGAARHEWSAFEASFFGPDFQAVEALSRQYDERTLDFEFKRIMRPADI
jgi:hypothetical protein